MTQKFAAGIILSDLRRELEDLKRAVAEDADLHHRDHLPNGRWAMIHRLAARIGQLERGEAAHG